MRRLNYLCALAIAATAVLPLQAQTAAAPAPASAAPTPLTPAQQARYMDAGKLYTRWFLGGKTDSLAAAFDSTTLARMGGRQVLNDALTQITERAGSELLTLAEKMTWRHGKPQFWHEGKFSELKDDTFVIRWLFDAEGRIVGAGLGPRSSTPDPDA